MFRTNQYQDVMAVWNRWLKRRDPAVRVEIKAALARLKAAR